MTDLSVGVLTADLLRLGEELESIAAAGVTRLHVDVMDGVFCPEITVGSRFVAALPSVFQKEVHLLVDDPLRKVGAFVDAGADTIVFHAEATSHPRGVLDELAGSGVARGIAVKPGTPLRVVQPLLDELELLLVLAVDPDRTDRRFIQATVRKLADAKAMIGRRDVVLAVDGGITRGNVEQVSALGVDLVVTGSAVFDGVDPAANARQVLAATRRAGLGPLPAAGGG